MTSEQKIIRAKVGLLELAKQLGNVSQDSFRLRRFGLNKLDPDQYVGRGLGVFYRVSYVSEPERHFQPRQK